MRFFQFNPILQLSVRRYKYNINNNYDEFLPTKFSHLLLQTTGLNTKILTYNYVLRDIYRQWDFLLFVFASTTRPFRQVCAHTVIKYNVLCINYRKPNSETQFVRLVCMHNMTIILGVMRNLSQRLFTNFNSSVSGCCSYHKKKKKKRFKKVLHAIYEIL